MEMTKKNDNLLEIAHAERFDQVSQQYVSDLNKNLSLTGSDSAYFYQAKINIIKKKLRSPPEVILDFGCGIGVLSRLLAETFPTSTIIGVDPSIESLRVGKKESFDFKERLHFYNQLEDMSLKPNLVIAAGVFHHIHYTYQQKNINSLFSCMAPNAELFIFEHNPFNPITRIIVARAEVDRGASLISPWSMKKMIQKAGFVQSQLDFISFFPAWLSFLLRFEPYLKTLPLGAQYLITCKKQD